MADVEEMESYRRGGGGSRCAIVPCVTEALGVGQTGFATVVSSLTQPAVLHSTTTRLVGVRALDWTGKSTESDASERRGGADPSYAP